MYARTVVAVEVAELVAEARAEGEARVALHPRQPLPQRQVAQGVVLWHWAVASVVELRRRGSVCRSTVCRRLEHDPLKNSMQARPHVPTHLGAGAGLLVGEEREDAPLLARQLPQPLRHLHTRRAWVDGWVCIHSCGWVPTNANRVDLPSRGRLIDNVTSQCARTHQRRLAAPRLAQHQLQPQHAPWPPPPPLPLPLLLTLTPS